MNPAVEILLSALLMIGGIFGLTGSFGLLRLRVSMQRVHAPTKAVTMGVSTALIAALLDLYVTTGHIPWQNLLVVPFLFVTAPLSALYLSKAHLHTTIDAADLPPTGTAASWATLGPGRDDGPSRAD